MLTVHLLNGVQKKIALGHPWIYRTQIDRVDHPDGEAPVPGAVADVLDFRGRYLGSGFYNPHSMIAVRLLTRRHETIDEDLIRSRVAMAMDYREILETRDTNSQRLIFAEADRLPGVIADKFADVIILQILSYGMERYTAAIADALIERYRPSCLILQNNEPIRSKEGLSLERKIYFGEDPGTVEIRENGIRLLVDLAGGQKTGYFLDQKANHRILRDYVAGKSVLDCFTYIGGFALNAALAGAAQVMALDISESAIRLAQTNAGLNGLGDRISFVRQNAFDFLRQTDQRYDVIVLDPPAFAKSHSAIRSATRGYKEINLSALRLLPPGGILATHSCSYHMSEQNFVDTVLSAASDAKRTVRIIDLRRADRDHPSLAGYPESHYLKSLWLQVLDEG